MSDAIDARIAGHIAALSVHGYKVYREHAVISREHHDQTIAALRSAAFDALAGWRYIRSRHSDLEGVGWDRVENKLTAALGISEPPPTPQR